MGRRASARLGIATVRLVGAGLFVRSLQHARSIDVGFDPSHMIVMSLNPALHGYDQPWARALYDRVLSAVSAVPGISSASLAATVPFGLTGSRRHGHRRV